jgi:hypothetical protein
MCSNQIVPQLKRSQENISRIPSLFSNDEKTAPEGGRSNKLNSCFLSVFNFILR